MIYGGGKFQGPQGVRRPVQYCIVKDLMLQRKESRDIHDRKIFSKNIHKQSRKELRSWRIKWADHLLSRFENTKYFQKIRSYLIQSSACSIDAEKFKEFLGILCSSSDLLLPNDEDKTSIRSYPPFSLPE